jgi:hypothetical protein
VRDQRFDVDIAVCSAPSGEPDISTPERVQ